MKRGMIFRLLLFVISLFLISSVSGSSFGVFITNPLNTTYTTNVSVINYTLTDNSGYCWYSNNSGGWISTYKNASVLNFTGVVSIEGSNAWRVYCNTSDGTQTYTDVNFFKDTIVPNLQITSPINYLNQTILTISINVSVSDSGNNISNTTFFIYDSYGVLINSTTNNSIIPGVRLANLAVPASGIYFLNFSVYDYAGNINSTVRNITADNTPPVIIVGSPFNNRIYYVNQSIPIYYNASDILSTTRWYNNGTRNLSYTGPVSLSYNLEGRYNLTLYANDSLGNLASLLIYFNVTTLPQNETIVTTNQSINVNENTSTIIVPPNSSLNSVSLTNSTAIVHFDLSQLMNGTTVALTNNFTLTTVGESGINYTAFIPNGVNITGGESWDGIITLPTINATSFTQPSLSGYTTTAPAIVLDMGSENESVNFSIPVKLIIGGMAGKRAAWARGSSSLTDISIKCNSADDPSNISSGECYADSGSDLVIWTYHFTSFAAYAATVTATHSNNAESSDASASADSSATATNLTTWYVLYPLSEQQFKQGTYKQLGEKYAFKFVMNGEDHIVGITSLSLSSAIFRVSSTPQIATISAGEEKKFEITGDNNYDILVKLISIKSGMANVSIKYINEKMPEQVVLRASNNTNASINPEDEIVRLPDVKEEAPKSKDAFSSKILWWIIGISILIILIIITVFIIIVKKNL